MNFKKINNLFPRNDYLIKLKMNVIFKEITTNWFTKTITFGKLNIQNLCIWVRIWILKKVITFAPAIDFNL